MLEFTKPTRVFLDHVQSRVELHGDEKVPAIDLTLHFTGGNQVLDEVAPGLRSTFFTAHTRQPSGKPQSEMDLAVDDMPYLRAPTVVPPVRVDCETEGATVVVSNGIQASTSIRLTECKVHKVRLTPVEGGSVELKFSVSSASGIDAQIVGALSMKQQQEIELTLVAPKADGQAAGTEVEGGVPWPFPKEADDKKPVPLVVIKKRRKLEKDAGEVFVEQHGKAQA